MIIIYDKDEMTGEELVRRIKDSYSDDSLYVQEADGIPQCLLLNDLGIIPVIAEEPGFGVEKRITGMGVIATMAVICGSTGLPPTGSRKDMDISIFRDGSPHIYIIPDVRLSTGMLILDSLIRRERHSPFGTFEKLLWSLDYRPEKPGYVQALTACASLMQSYEDRRFYLLINSEAEGFGKTESEMDLTMNRVERSLIGWYRGSLYSSEENHVPLYFSRGDNSLGPVYDPIPLMGADSIKQLIVNLKYINVCRRLSR